MLFGRELFLLSAISFFNVANLPKSFVVSLVLSTFFAAVCAAITPYLPVFLSILKNFDGAIKGQVTSFLKKVKYRFLATATPSPNDYIELGTSSEALGYMGYMDMLSKFFKNNQNNSKIY